ncbi:hypothetical protein BS78_05G227100 [Paspalum vaginatum]|nr:hypothetical protein BS78_05G227100 [Paspalum vaginatum]
MAAHKLLLLAMLLLSAVAVCFGAAAAVTAGKDELCRPGCTDAYWNCNDLCLKLGYTNGTCYRPPLPFQCCCSR